MDSDHFQWADEQPDDGEGVTATIDDEGVVRVPSVPRHTLIVIEVELLERVLTHVYSEGLRRRPVVPE